MQHSQVQLDWCRIPTVPTYPYLKSLVKQNWYKFRGLIRHSTGVVILPDSSLFKILFLGGPGGSFTLICYHPSTTDITIAADIIAAAPVHWWVLSTNFLANNLNFHRRQMWWDRIQAIFLDIFYFNSSFSRILFPPLGGPGGSFTLIPYHPSAAAKTISPQYTEGDGIKSRLPFKICSTLRRLHLIIQVSLKFLVGPGGSFTLIRYHPSATATISYEDRKFSPAVQNALGPPVFRVSFYISHFTRP